MPIYPKSLKFLLDILNRNAPSRSIFSVVKLLIKKLVKCRITYVTIIKSLPNALIVSALKKYLDLSKAPLSENKIHLLFCPDP